MLITKQIALDMGHRVPNHKSKCRNLHGHRYVIEVGVDDEVIIDSGASDEGMVIDFGDLKRIMVEEIEEVFDHGFVMFSWDDLKKEFLLFKQKDLKIIFVPFIPTAENLAQYWYELLEPRLQQANIQIKYVKVWETPSSTALYQK